METKIKTYGEFKNAELLDKFIYACTRKGLEIDCNILEVKIYGDYGWAQAAFLVDQFGGIAALVNVYADGHYSVSTDSRVIEHKTLDAALAPVADAYKWEVENRHAEMFNCD